MKLIHFTWAALFGVFLFSCTAGDTIKNESIRIIPLPNYYQLKPGTFDIDKHTSIAIDKSDSTMVALASYFNEKLARVTRYELPVKDTGEILFELVTAPELDTEGYRICVTSDKIRIRANAYHGIFNGIQSLLQLIPLDTVAGKKSRWEIGCIEITDKPRFAWRGLMLDVSRHFFTKQEVKRYIDLMAEYKYNVFHWHLTDDQGWRIEIKSLPRLTSVGAWRAPRVGNWWERSPQSDADSLSYGGYYTQDDIREIVEYARTRYVTVVPEIDIPGHSMALLAAYPEVSCMGGPFCVNVGNPFYTKEENSLCVGKERTFALLDSIFGEIVSLFPSEYIHIGGDECYKGFWEQCPDCKRRMALEKLNSTTELQSYFVKRVASSIQRMGKIVIGWDEILEGGLAPEAIVMSWRGKQGGIEAIRQGHAVVMTPFEHCYLDLYQGDPAVEPNTYSMLRLEDCYKFQLVPDSVDNTFVLGGQGNLWTESVPHYRQAEYMTWPRALAISETLWNESCTKNWEFFVQRVEKQFIHFEQLGVNYARSIYDPIIKPFINDEGELRVALRTEVDGLDIYYTFDNTNPDSYSNLYTGLLSIPKDASMLKVVTYSGQQRKGRQINLTIEELERRVKETN